MLPVMPLPIILALESPAQGANGRHSTATERFTVAVSGRAGQPVRLRALDVPRGEVVSFCTRRVCALFRVTVVLPRWGREPVDVLLAGNGSARPRSSVRIAIDGARTVSLRRRGPA